MFKWTEEAEKTFKDIKEFFISPLVLRAPIPDGLFQLESDILVKVLEALYFKSKETNGLLLVTNPKDCLPQLKISE